MSKNLTKQYVCIEFVNKQSDLRCVKWQELQSQPFLPDMTKQQANELTIAILMIISIAFGWLVLIKLVRKFSDYFR